jgi:hypothetical protein
MASSWQTKGWGLVESFDRKANESREPAKFEAGMVVKASGAGLNDDTLMLVCAVYADRVLSDNLTSGGGRVGFYPAEFDIRIEILSPAPRLGDTWSSGESVARISADPHTAQLRIVSEGEPFVGDVVAVARRLWEGGYRWAGATHGRPVAKRSELRPYRAPAYVALDDLKACVPTHGEQATPLRVRQGAPAPRDIAKGETVEVEIPLVPWSAVQADPSRAYNEQVRLVNEAMSKVDLGDPTGYRWTTALDDRVGCTRQARIDATTPQSPLDGALIDAAQLRAPHVCAVASKSSIELSAGMVVRHESIRAPVFGVVLSVRYDRVSIRWTDASEIGSHETEYVRNRLSTGRWRIVDPDVRPLASLANAVAAIFAPCDRATSRRYVDIALAQLRGEPFADAIRAALVGASEQTNLTPFEIAACVAALRHWEARRPFERDLAALQRRNGDRTRGGPWNRLQVECRDLLCRTLGYAPDWNFDGIFFLYERARAA